MQGKALFFNALSLALWLLTTLIEANPMTANAVTGLTLRQTVPNCPAKGPCGEQPGLCNAKGCDGINNPDGSLGTCTAGKYIGCPCTTESCPNPQKRCGDGDCKGLNNPTGPSYCTTGKAAGCECIAACTGKEECTKPNCYGFNMLDMSKGYCTTGRVVGCPCLSGCAADGPCNKAGCKGISNQANGKGVCTQGPWSGCRCNSVCGKDDGPCGKCAGQNGVCTEGDYAGCTCK